MTDAAQTESSPSWPGGHQTDPPVTVRTFARTDERMPVQAFLESEGVACFNADGNVLSIDPGLYVAVGFYKLQVPTSQVEIAQALLAEWDDADPLPANVDTGAFPAAEETPLERRGTWAWLLILAAVIAGIAFFVAGR